MSKKPRKTGPAPPRRRRGNRLQPRQNARRAAPNDTAERIARALEAIAAHLSAASPAPTAPDSFGSADAFVWHPERTAGAGAARQPRRSRPAQGDRPDARHPDREYRALCRRPARQQRVAVGRARHGKIVAGEGGACQHQRQPQAGRPPEADRNSPRGYRKPAGVDGPAAQLGFSASSCSATICRSTATTPPTSR